MTAGGAQRPPADRVDDVALILEVMRAAVREAVLRHKRLGNPIAVWREGRVVWLAPHEIPSEPEESRPGGA